MRFVFWICLFGAVYSYFLYPGLLMMLPRRVPSPRRSHDSQPALSVIITAYNERDRIGEKIENTLALNYPRDKLQVIVASDSSDDGTDEIVRSFGERGVELRRAEGRRGKEYAQIVAIQAALGDIIVFSDVATRLPPDSLRVLAACFEDPRVGAVSSEDRFVAQDGALVGEGAYVRYEMWLRRLESAVNSLVGLSGSFFAARRSICEDWDTDVPSDFNVALNSVRAGYIAVSCPGLFGIYLALRDEGREYQRKYRTIIRGLSAVFKQPSVLNPFVFGLFSFQALSHKVMRWMVPWFLIGLFLSTLFLAGSHWVYGLALLGQLAFYLVVLLGAYSRSLRSVAAVKIPYFFAQVNVAIVHATVDFLRGKRVTRWEPSRR